MKQRKICSPGKSGMKIFKDNKRKRVSLIASVALLLFAIWFSLFKSADNTPLTDDNIPFTRVTLRDAIAKNDLGSITVADINKDGKIDIIAGGIWYQNPGWEPHTFYAADTKKYIDSTRGEVYDIDGDGYLDILGDTTPVRGKIYSELFWLKNPGPPHTGIWEQYFITAEHQFLEIIKFVDIDGDNQMEMITVDDGWGKNGGLRIYEIPSEPTHPNQQDWKWRWVVNKTLHGLAIDDLNNDGIPDIASDFRWYERVAHGEWVEHAMPAPPRNDHGDSHKRGHLTMHSLIYDVDNDGDKDVIFPRAHNYGVFWMESSGGEEPEFTLHEMLPGQLPSTIHGAAYGDIDGDGDTDIFAGKCRYRHGDPGEWWDPLDVFWLELVRSDGSVRWIKHQLAKDLNMGFGPAVADIDNDGDMDLVMGAMGHARGKPSQHDVTMFRNELSTLLKPE